MLIGHRGCRLGEPRGDGPPPENTLEAFSYALDKGADGFELDTRLTKDGVPVVFHDAHVGRCLQSDGGPQLKVSDLTLEELRRLPYKCAPKVIVPTLDDALALARRRNAKILIETKDIHKPAELAAQVVSLIRKHGAEEDAVVISFDPRSLYYVRSYDPEIRTCFLWVPGLVTHYRTAGTEELPASWRWLSPLLDVLLVVGAHPALLPSFLGVSALGPETHFRKTNLRAAKRRGMSTYLWVVNEGWLRDDVRKLAEDGLFAYSTDDLWER